MRGWVVITSIHAPTEGVQGFACREECDVLVVGDRKTPPDWCCHNVTFLPVAAQSRLSFRVGRYLPYNHYCRKMLGYLYAMSLGAEMMIDADDDNIPRKSWGFPAFAGEYPTLPGGLGFVNVYELYTEQHIWPRGYPLRLAAQSGTAPRSRIRVEQAVVGVWQGLADETPDVDAVYRLTNDQPCSFRDAGHHVLGRGTLSPFNSQNTAFRKETFCLLYLPAFVTFRFTDILRGLVAQPVMWQSGYHLGFTNATVVQKRNTHDYMQDFESEIPMYLQTERVVELVSGAVSAGSDLAGNLFNAYGVLHRADLVTGREMRCLEAWLLDCSDLV